jgi:cell division septation protein DedD
MNIEKHISELLFSHDYSPARIHPTQHTFSPPSKSIVFNRNLKNNDGLLANYIAQQEELSYNEALQHVSQFASTCSQSLASGQKLLLRDVGQFYHDVEKNIQFEPNAEINYLLESFGLTALQSPAIKRDNFVKRLEKEQKDRDVVPAEIKRRISVKRYVALSLSAAALFALIWIPLETNLLKGVNYANLNPFSKKEKAIYSENNFKAPSVKSPSLSATSAEGNLPDTTKYTHISFANKSATPLVVRMEEASAAESTAVSNPASEKIKNSGIQILAGDKYSIIGGCFAVPENADHFVAKLKAEGFDAFILETNRSSLRHVSYGSYSSYNQAVAALSRIRSSNKEAWLFIK